MKVPVSLLFAVGFVLVSCAAISADASPPKLEEIPAAIEQLNKDLTAKLDNVSKIVDAEAAAGRLSEPAAQTLRWTLQTAVSATGKLQLRTLISSSRLPTDNAKVMAALTELEAANTESQTHRTRLAADATREVQARLSSLLRGATKREECENFERAVSAVRTTFQGDSGFSSQSAGFSNVTNISQRLAALLAAESSGRRDQIAAAAASLQGFGNFYDASGFSFSAELEERAARAIKPLNDAIAAAQDALVEAFLAGKPVAELEAAFRRFSEACDGYVAPRNPQFQSVARDPRETLPAYESLVSVWKAVERGDDADTLKTHIQHARSVFSSIPRARLEKIRAALDGIEGKVAERAEKQTQERVGEIQRRLAAVGKPAELDAIAADLTGWAREARTHGRQDGSESWSLLATELATLAAAWGSSSGMWPQERPGESQLRHPALAATLRDLRRRIEREVISRQMRAPELNAAPLNAMETDAALEALADQFVAKNEWRRLLEFSEARMSMQSARGRFIQDDSVPALRTFFAAQNLELAEQWADAAQAYKTVLTSSSARAPIAPAAEKLKALLKAHPEAATHTPNLPPPLPGAMPVR